MAGLFLHHRDDAAPAPAWAAAVEAQFARHGFAASTPLALPGWRGLHVPYIASPLATCRARHGTLVAVAGTIAVDGRCGEEALAALPDAVGPRGPDWSRVAGQFAAVVSRGGRTWLFTDYLGAFPLYHDAGRGLFSTSLLALTEALPRVAFDPQGVHEWVFNVATTGDDTVFAGIRTLGPGTMVELTPGGAVLHPLATPLADGQPHHRVEQHRDVLASVVAPYVAAFERVRAPLSGGIDARLVLAALRREGAAPEVYVYGPEASADVRIARAIGAAEGFAVEWTDKRAGLPDPDSFAARVEAEFHALDALPNYGNIFDNGGNAAALAARHAGGALAVSGGGGEVYRDFFYLPGATASPRDVARAFFARFAASDAIGFDRRTFLDRIAAKIAAALGVGADDRLPRAAIDQAYPRVRCRALFGREIGLEARHGPYLMPFLDHRVIAEAATLPLARKHAGRFEAALLTSIDPVLAAYQSAYGHCFAYGPSRSHRLGEWGSRSRPLWLRERAYAIRRRLGPMDDEHGGLLDIADRAGVIDPAFPVMRRYFAIDRIGDAGLKRRIAALEYLAGHLGGRLAA